MNKTDVMSQMLSLNKSTHWIKPINNLYHLIITSRNQRWFSMKLLEDRTGTESWAKGNPSNCQCRTCRVCACSSPGAAWAPSPALAAAPALLGQAALPAPQGFMKTLECQGGLPLMRHFSRLFSIKLTYFEGLSAFRPPALPATKGTEKKGPNTFVCSWTQKNFLWFSLFSHFW